LARTKSWYFCWHFPDIFVNILYMTISYEINLMPVCAPTGSQKDAPANDAVMFFPARTREDFMGKSALYNGLAIAALLTWVPASAQEPKMFSKSDLLSQNVGPSQGNKIAGVLCDGRLLMSPMAVAADFVGDLVAEGRGAAATLIVKLIGKKAETVVCEKLVVKSPTPEPDWKSKDVTATMPRPVISPDQPIAAAKPLSQQLCSPGQLYDVKAQLCVDLEVIPNCPSGQLYLSGQCTDVASLARPRCAAYEEYDIFANKCFVPRCHQPLIYNPLEDKCVSKISFGGVSCRADQLESYGACKPMPLR
jgi:hypothetical protein